MLRARKETLTAPPPWPDVAGIRKALHLTQADLAHALGVHRVSVARWEGREESISNKAKQKLTPIVEKELLRGIRYSRDVKRRAALLARAVVSGPTLALTRPDWQRVLLLEARVLEGVPPHGHSIPGFEVGAALEAAIHGQTYAEYRAIRERELAELFGNHRLMRELEDALVQFIWVHGIMPNQIARQGIAQALRNAKRVE
jgi:transcriptional regulator with XRE-family HTH domain